MIFTGIGSREAPEDHLEILKELGYRWCINGDTMRSGGAKGSDEAVYDGFLQGRRNGGKGSCEIYLPWDRFRHYQTDPAMGFYNANDFSNWSAARTLALGARGGDGGLNAFGVRLHSRNVYQVLGKDLATPSDAVVLSAPLTASTRKVRGGTNTAYVLALLHHIPTWNLQIARERQHVLDYLASRDNVTLTTKD